ncbi:MAG TPA: hypothetical protein EYH52_10915 [Acinetobacter venetianus]|uniref:hypothetical protein n=1 Tax=Acinetobacter venetianus TaxID=52133 RepID=UPI001A175F70|nr:hypothetical protein [Acinetobacter venetianus]HIQ35131.1 hypothetical protein [Acinetobacter venetianus]
MKKFLVLGALSFLLSASIFARETNSMRSTTEAIFVGDTEEMLINKMGKKKPKYYVYEDGSFVCATTEHKYDIDMQEYTIFICRGKIFKIDVKNK